MIKTKKQMFIVIGVFALVMMLGTVTYAFFNYTRTGSANTVGTGRIAFNSSQSPVINLSNAFPIDVTEGIPNDSTKVGSITINVRGDTNYSGGVEYLVSAINVTNTVGSGATAKTLPISIDVSVTGNTENDPTTTLGTSDNSYFTNRGTSAATSIYKVLAGDTLTEDTDILVGYIKSGSTGVDGNITIRAYIDMAKVAISDTYPEENTDTNNDGYIDGTTTTWKGDRVVFTTAEWDALRTSGISFQVKVESRENVWVNTQNASPAVVPTIDSCPGCVFTYYSLEEHDNYYLGIDGDANVLTSAEYTDNYQELVATTGRNYFIGLIIENDVITKAYSCGIKNNVPFCLEYGDELYDDHVTTLQSLWNNTCTYKNNKLQTVQNVEDSRSTECDDGTFNAMAQRDGFVAAGTTGEGYCEVDYEGMIACYDE